jgi:hypothetical protein
MTAHPLPPDHQGIGITDDEHVHARATTTDGRETDNFGATVTGPRCVNVYNVARTGVLVAWADRAGWTRPSPGAMIALGELPLIQRNKEGRLLKH